jgi:hypothetical protein
MRGKNIHKAARQSIFPVVPIATAREHQGVHDARGINDRQSHVSIGGYLEDIGNAVPHKWRVLQVTVADIDLGQ